MAASDLCRIIIAIINIITNLLILVLGLGVLAIGIAGIALVNTYLSASEFIIYINSLFILVILIGFFITLICIFAIIGSVAAFNSNSAVLKGVSICLLMFAVGGMVVVLIGEIAGVSLAFVFRSQVTDRLTDTLLLLLNDTFTNNPTQADNIIVPIQTFFDCCGVNGPNDYNDIPAIGNDTALPEGCCRSLYSMCTLSNDSNTYRSEGCASLIISVTTMYFNVVIGVGITILILSIAAIIMPLLLTCVQCFKEEGGLKIV